MNLSKAHIKQIRALRLKKYRDQESLFIAEGDKLVRDLLPHLQCTLLVATSEWLQIHAISNAVTAVASAIDLKSASAFTSQPPVLAIFRKPAPDTISAQTLQSDYILALDDVQDPGNLGTIVRTADWFGIRHVVCSLHCADIYNPKAVQATMGAIAKVQILYTNLPEFLSTAAAHTPICGTFLDGKNIYCMTLPTHGIFVLGNEGQGVSSTCAAHVQHRLFIPPADGHVSESLNVSAAAAIICSELRRKC